MEAEARSRRSPKRQDWEAKLLCRVDAKGNPTRTRRPVLANVVTILTHHPDWEGVLAYDDFGDTIVTRRCPPWRAQDTHDGVKPGDWSDIDTARLQSWLSEWYVIDVGLETILAAVRIASDRVRVHAVREWFESLRWDGVRRLPSWLSDVFGCRDSAYTRAVGTAWAVSAVARIMAPGCKVDTVLVLEGAPGLRKSSALRELVGDDWFFEMAITDVANKDAMQVLRRKWIAEFPEIDGLSRNEQAHVKSYFSRQVDRYRESYGKMTRDYPRQCIFAATTNKEQYLTDETGGTGRRMWPVRVTREGDRALIRATREQLWAEAFARYTSSEEWHFTDPELRQLEREEQDSRFRSDPWEQSVAEWLAKPTDIGARSVKGVSTADVMAALGIETSRRSHHDAGRVGAILRRLGWVPGNPEVRDGVRTRVYRPETGAGTNGHTLYPLESAPPTPLDSSDLPHEDELFPPQIAE